MTHSSYLKFQIIAPVKGKDPVAVMKYRTVIHSDQRIVAGPADIAKLHPLTEIRDRRKIIHRKEKLIYVLHNLLCQDPLKFQIPVIRLFFALHTVHLITQTAECLLDIQIIIGIPAIDQNLFHISLSLFSPRRSDPGCAGSQPLPPVLLRSRCAFRSHPHVPSRVLLSLVSVRS